MNLLQETKEAITESGHTPANILFIGSETTGHSCTWEEFCLLADVEYNEGYGPPSVARDLIIVFHDGQKLLRAQFEDTEWWEVELPFQPPEFKLPITRLVDEASWFTLADINKPAEENS
jgi:hypothetical protein